MGSLTFFSIFKPCGNMSWEGVEVAQHKEELKRIKQQ
jgi:hypothetical protein